MRPQRVLFIGGSGVISSACSRLAVERGVELTVLNRGVSHDRPLPDGVRVLRADVRDADAGRARRSATWSSTRSSTGWPSPPSTCQADLDLFRGRTGQYVFISSASAYQTPPARVPVTESTPLRNPFWQYSRDKIACEDLLVARLPRARLPGDDRAALAHLRPDGDPASTAAGRPSTGCAQGKPVVVHGDGTSLWTLTHHEDFARGFVPLLGHPRAVGEAFHITSDDVLTWDQITARARRGRRRRGPHRARPLRRHRRRRPRLGRRPARRQGALDGLRQHQAARASCPASAPAIPFEQGAREIVDWYDADPARQVVDARLDAADGPAGGHLGDRPRLSRPFSPTAAGHYGDGPGDPPAERECACDCSSPEEPGPRAVPWWPRRWPAATRSAS